MLTDQPLIFVLVLVAAIAVGWLLRGRASGREAQQEQSPIMRDDYFKGLNHLLNEEPDKALEVFMRMVQVDSDTIETHFALGSLFRRRGEVDRAIRIHQNLIARPSLSRVHRQQALYELGQDYMRAGLLDRAESLFSELADSGVNVESALRQLMTIYEQQSDWDQAIAAAQRLEAVEGTPQRRTISHYHCELAEMALEHGQIRRAAQAVRKARSSDPGNARAEMVAGMLADAENEPADAIRAYQRAVELDPAFAGEVLAPLQAAYRRNGDAQGFDSWLAGLHRSAPQALPAVALAAFCDQSLAGPEISRAMQRYLESRGQGLARLVERLGGQRSLHPEMELEAARTVVSALFEDHPHYLCGECGFTGNTLFWQCPGCRAWSSVRPNTEFPHSPTASALPDGTGRR